jgi:hypothetical protein
LDILFFQGGGKVKKNTVRSKTIQKSMCDSLKFHQEYQNALVRYKNLTVQSKLEVVVNKDCQRPLLQSKCSLKDNLETYKSVIASMPWICPLEFQSLSVTLSNLQSQLAQLFAKKHKKLAVLTLKMYTYLSAIETKKWGALQTVADKYPEFQDRVSGASLGVYYSMTRDNSQGVARLVKSWKPRYVFCAAKVPEMMSRFKDLKVFYPQKSKDPLFWCVGGFSAEQILDLQEDGSCVLTSDITNTKNLLEEVRLFVKLQTCAFDVLKSVFYSQELQKPHRRNELESLTFIRLRPDHLGPRVLSRIYHLDQLRDSLTVKVKIGYSDIVYLTLPRTVIFSLFQHFPSCLRKLTKQYRYFLERRWRRKVTIDLKNEHVKCFKQKVPVEYLESTNTVISQAFSSVRKLYLDTLSVEEEVPYFEKVLFEE